MTGIELSLVLVSIVCLLVASVVGLLFPEWRRLWKWTDPIYYFLAGVGVILLFVSSERERTLASLRLDREQLERLHLALGPAPGGFDDYGWTEFGPTILKTSYDGIKAITHLGQACNDPGNGTCSA